MPSESSARHSWTTSERRLSAEDFETSSIRSAAPSYVSEAPSYHSTVPITEPIPAYSPRGSAPPAPPPVQRTTSAPAPQPSAARTRGLPPVPTGPVGRVSNVPVLSEFRIQSWSHINSNPTYRRVANRRAKAQASTSMQSQARQGVRMMLERVEEEERASSRFRHLEDPYLVGEEAAAKARRQRLARETGDILMREERSWDWFLTQVQDWDGRERLRREFESMSRRSRLAEGFTGRF